MQELQDLNLDSLSMEQLEQLTNPLANPKQTIPFPQQPEQQKHRPSRPTGGLRKSGRTKQQEPDKAPSDFQTAMEHVQKRSSKDQVRLQNLIGIYASVGGGLMMINQTDGLIILSSAEKAATSVLAVAKMHPEMMKWVDSLGKYGAYSMLVAVHLEMFYMIAKNHNAVPKGFKNPFTAKVEQPTEQQQAPQGSPFFTGQR